MRKTKITMSSGNTYIANGELEEVLEAMLKENIKYFQLDNHYVMVSQISELEEVDIEKIRRF